MTPRLASGPEHEEFAKSIRGICADWFRDEGEIQVRPFDTELWRALGEAGVWGAATGGGGDVEDLAVAAEALGAEAIAGPVVPTSVALGLLSDDEREPVESGSVLATVSDGHPIVAWGCDAEVVFLLTGDRTARRARFDGESEWRETLGLERWARRAVTGAGAALDAERPLAIGNVVAGAYAVGAAGRVLDLTVDYAETRHQFDQPLISFQTVSHRLAQSFAELDSAAALVATAGRLLSADSAVPWSLSRATAASARLHATDVAVRLGFLGHQLAGGMGYVSNSLLATLTRRVQQLVHVPPAREVLVAASIALMEDSGDG